MHRDFLHRTEKEIPALCSTTIANPDLVVQVEDLYGNLVTVPSAQSL
jgi:hypothetical protein